MLLQPRPALADKFGAEVVPALGVLLDDSLAADDAIAAPRRYSLISPAGDGVVSVHQLVRAVTADQMAGNLLAQWRQATAAVIEAAIPASAERGCWGPDHPRHPDRPRSPRLLDRGGEGSGRGPGTSSPPCCPCKRGCSAPATPALWLPAATSPTGLRRRKQEPLGHNAS